MTLCLPCGTRIGPVRPFRVRTLPSAPPCRAPPSEGPADRPQLARVLCWLTALQLRTSGKPTLVDFYATWCGPCVLMANILNETAPELKESVQMVKIDTDKYPRIASQYRVEGLPTLVLFSADGRVLDRMEGVVQGPQLVERIRYFLAGEADKQEGAAAEGAV